MRLTYFGHSAFQIETGDTTILVDPFIEDNDHTTGIVEAGDLAPDVILLTHAHFDHLGDAPDIATRSGALVIAPFELAMHFKNEHDHENIQPVNPGGSVSFDWGTVHCIHAEHSSSLPDGSYGGAATGFVLEAEGTTLYNTGDTGFFGDMARIGERFAIDLALMPIGDAVTMGAAEAVEAVKACGAKRTVPLHYGTFPFLDADPSDWSAKMRDAGLTAEALAPGQSLTV